jgi:hypothetical protein
MGNDVLNLAPPGTIFVRIILFIKLRICNLAEVHFNEV